MLQIVMLSKAFLPHIQGPQTLSRSRGAKRLPSPIGFPVSSSQQGRATPPSRQLQGTAPGAHRLFPGTPSPQPRCCTRLRTAKGRQGNSSRGPLLEQPAQLAGRGFVLTTPFRARPQEHFETPLLIQIQQSRLQCGL